MVRKSKKLRAIDLYSGIGGWALGLRLAGIEVVASYEQSGAANETNFKNNHHLAQTVDIRRLSLDELPSSIDIVVGSPPCTQFSYSNRGGNGDIEDGLKDIIKFLSVVDHLQPRSWAMENVPRVATIIQEEVRAGGRLRRFRHLNIDPKIVKMEDFGLPQRRTRCIVGNFSFDLLAAYSSTAPKRTLGTAIRALANKRLRDPIYGFTLRREHLSDHVLEDALSIEEARINRANKVFHPVYNSMTFPDPLDRAVRTITATCTRVSRESVVIAAPDNPTKYRRLTIRERATLQGFPITFQFYGSTYGKKLEMVGNAIPPLFSYYIAHAIRETAPVEVPKLSQLGPVFELPATLPEDTSPERAGTKYPPDRKFRFAISNLRLKSGVRFELVNVIDSYGVRWVVNFYFGTSKSIHSIKLDRALGKRLLNRLPDSTRANVGRHLNELSEFIASADVERMQLVWAHRGLGRTTPLMFLDMLDETSRELRGLLSHHVAIAERLVAETIEQEFPDSRKKPLGVGKLIKNAPAILTGLLLGSITNSLLLPRQATTKAQRLGTA